MATAGNLRLRDNLRMARWLLSQGDKLGAMLAYAQAYRDADTVRGKWEDGLRPAGDMGVTIYESFPAYEANDVVTLGELQSTAVTLGVDAALFAWFVAEFLPLVLELITKLRS